jgi:hypothetical protein
MLVHFNCIPKASFGQAAVKCFLGGATRHRFYEAMFVTDPRRLCIPPSLHSVCELCRVKSEKPLNPAWR